jgi:chemotaxis protein methyltransferase CheR
MSGNDAVKEGREFHFSKNDFDKVCKLIYDHAGISLGESKQELVYSRLSRRLRATGIQTFGEYLKLLESNNEKEWEEFANSLTTNLTSFFREGHHFPLLATYLKSLSAKSSINIWCSAASTGEEPYTIAMTVLDALGRSASKVHIVATDIDTKVLATAQAGVYSVDRIEKLPEDVVKRHFLRGKGAQEGMVRVRPELKELITFQRLNLLDKTWPIRGPFDVLFCRNVMIYFDKPTQLSILQKFAPMMTSEGLLFAGHSESFHNAEDYFKLRGKTVYELAPKVKKQAADNERKHGAKG